MKFSALENVTIGIQLGDAGSEVDFELQKSDVNVEQDNTNNMLLWHVPNLHDSESAVLSFASKSLSFDDMFPLDVRFHEQYSLIDMNLASDTTKPMDALTGDEMSLKFTTNLQTDGYKVNLE